MYLNIKISYTYRHIPIFHTSLWATLWKQQYSENHEHQGTWRYKQHSYTSVGRWGPSKTQPTPLPCFMRDAGLVCSLEKGRCKFRKLKKQPLERSRCRETERYQSPHSTQVSEAPLHSCAWSLQEVSRLCAINYPFAWASLRQEKRGRFCHQPLTSSDQSHLINYHDEKWYQAEPNGRARSEAHGQAILNNAQLRNKRLAFSPWIKRVCYP